MAALENLQCAYVFPTAAAAAAIAGASSAASISAEIASAPLFLMSPSVAAVTAGSIGASALALPRTAATVALNAVAPQAAAAHIEIAAPLAAAAASAQAASAGAIASTAGLMIALPLMGVAGWKALQNVPKSFWSHRGRRSGVPVMRAGDGGLEDVDEDLCIGPQREKSQSKHVQLRGRGSALAPHNCAKHADHRILLRPSWRYRAIR
jgi:hypothetical protein